jgi:ABC-2 type transport system permease protein
MTALVTLGAFLRRDLAISVSYRVGFVFELAADLFSLALFFYLGRLVDRSGASQDDLQRGYFAFAVIGIALLGIGQTGLSSFGQKIRQEQTTGTFEALMSTPSSQSLLVLCSAAFDMVRAAMQAAVFVLLAIAVFGLRLTTDPGALLTALAALAASILLFAAIGVAVAAFTVVFKQSTALVRLLVPAFALLGGVYFPLDVMPRPLRIISEGVPFTWALRALRDALVAGKVDATSLLLLIAGASLAVPIALGLFKLGMRRARMAGSLAQY